MTGTRRVGRRMADLPYDLPPARRAFAAEVRRLHARSGLSLRELAEAAHWSPSSLSRVFNGVRLIKSSDLPFLAQALRLSEEETRGLELRAQRAQAEALGEGGPHSDRSALFDHLLTLQEESGLSLREISQRLELDATPLSKSSIERALRHPDRALPHALQVAKVLIDSLPETERKAAAEGVLNAALAASRADAADSVTPRTATHEAVVVELLQAVIRRSLSLSAQAPDAPLPEATLSTLSQSMAALTASLTVPELPPHGRAIAASTGRSTLKPISEWNPFDLEVHPAVEPSGHRTGQVLPAYVVREPDRLLLNEVAAAGAGSSRMVVLVGTSSSGKTRACWEAVKSLASGGWKLWHPFDPTRAEEALESMRDVAPRTVVWLNESQHYLGHPRHGERIAAALRDLLARPDRGPVLVMGTLWPEYASRFTDPPAAGVPDPHAQVRALLAGRLIHIPDGFDDRALESANGLAQQGDARLAEALAYSVDGRVTQFLAGAPALVTRYHAATPAARAVLHAAMDARRCGAGAALPAAFLADAAVDYLSDAEFDTLPNDWTTGAFEEVTRAVHGHMAPMTKVRTPAGPRVEEQVGTAAQERAPDGAFQVAEYLVQVGKMTRRSLFPPASFWHAAYDYLAPPDLFALSEAAFRGARLEWANGLLRRAVDLGGDVGATSDLYRRAVVTEQSGDLQGAEALYEQAVDAGDPLALFRMAQKYEHAGDSKSLERLARKAADLEGFLPLTDAQRLEQEGDREGAKALYGQAADAGDPSALFLLAQMHEEAGDSDGAERVARKAADAGHAWLFDFPARWPHGLDPDGGITIPRRFSDEQD
ncbi:helix-turn-helix domain-containing protein [Streptomyces sp. NPDC003703]|uniref:helix-turn-helix domain-containing protein n=1 Tax=Streptomyces sp. NPDC003283 TaxID=3364681 RepID=UPI0036CAEDD5